MFVIKELIQKQGYLRQNPVKVSSYFHASVAFISRQTVAALDAATERRVAIIARNELPCFIRPSLTFIG
jgi:hypothetical protein